MSRGGSRWGAGRPGTKAIGEHLQRVDLRVWTRRGYLRQSRQFVWTWKRGEEHAGSVSVWLKPPESVTLEYTLLVNGSQQTVNTKIELESLPCRFGGWRHWFACPCCGRRAALLYLRWGRFACRHCQRVAYASQSDDELGRMWRKQTRLEARLGDHWSRPKGMRLATYERLFRAALDCEQRRETVLEELMRSLL